MMRSPSTLALAFCLIGQVGHSQATRLPDTLKKLNETSAQFRSAQADFHKVLTQNFLGEKTDTLQDGMIYVEGKGPRTQLGLVTTGKEARSVDYKDGNLRLFNPALGCYNKVASKSGQAESFLSLGFGGSGDDLQREWVVTDLGPETLPGDGKPVIVEKLSLVPKSQAVRNNFTSVTLWIDLSRGIALKQVLLAPSGDITTAVYSHIRLNQPINKKPYEFKDVPCK